MSFIRRWIGGATAGGEPGPGEGGGSGGRAQPGHGREPTPEEIEADERAHELELLRAEQDRLDELRQRQLRYANRSWTPPAQGGERRADDAEGEQATADTDE